MSTFLSALVSRAGHLVGGAAMLASVSVAHAQWTANGSSIFYNTGNVGIRTTTPFAGLTSISNTVSGAIGLQGIGHSAASRSIGVRGTTYSGNGYGGVFDGGQYGIFSQSVAPNGNTVGVWGQVTSPNGWGAVFKGGRWGVWGEANGPDRWAGYFVGRGFFSGSVGIGTSSPQFLLHVVEPVGTAVWGRSGAASGFSSGVVGESNSPTGFGVVGTSSALTGLANGVAGETNSPNGVAINGFARATQGVTNGVKGEVWSPSGVGVYGLSHATSGGFSNGVHGETASSTGLGVSGLVSRSFGLNAGVQGATQSLSAGWGVYSVGDSGSSGFKAFNIDHPLDPANKYLNHFSAEGPEALLIYRGNAELDDQGRAWVELPNYFESINRDFTYQLTAIGAPAPMLHIATRIKGNRFEISGGSSGLSVSWIVTGIRNDPYARSYGKPVEQAKPAERVGRYLHPELYGKSEELGVIYRPASLFKAPASVTPIAPHAIQVSPVLPEPVIPPAQDR